MTKKEKVPAPAVPAPASVGEGDSGKRVHNDIATFMTAWERSETVQEAADKLGITKASAGQRASTCRSKGLPLKKMKRGGNGAKIDIEAAKELLATLQAEAEGEGEGEV